MGIYNKYSAGTRVFDTILKEEDVSNYGNRNDFKEK